MRKTFRKCPTVASVGELIIICLRVLSHLRHIHVRTNIQLAGCACMCACVRVVSILLIVLLLGAAIAYKCAHSSSNVIIFAISLLGMPDEQLSRCASSEFGTMGGSWEKIRK